MRRLRFSLAWIIVGLAVLLLLALTGCQPPAPMPTVTPTRTAYAPGVTPTPLPAVQPTPTLTATPTPTPTSTPTATPTPTPIPTFPPQAQELQGWPALPHDLYFLREGRLWRWPLGGGMPEQLPRPAGADQVLDYRITPDGRVVVYLASDGKLYALDRASNTTAFLPTAGYLVSQRGPFFDLTPDGRYLVYLAWGIQPDAGPTHSAAEVLPGGPEFGTFFALDLTDPRKEFALGFCAVALQQGEVRPCYGFVLSPDGGSVAYADARGLWLATLPYPTGRTTPAGSPIPTPVPPGVPAPRLLKAHDPSTQPCHLWLPRQWSPDGRQLALDVGCEGGTGLAVLDLVTGQFWQFPDLLTDEAHLTENEPVWSGEGLWVAQRAFSEQQGSLALWQLGAEGAYQVTRFVSIAASGVLWPSALVSSSDGWIGFAHQTCVGCPGLESGLYFWLPDETITLAAPLPPCQVEAAGCGRPGARGTVAWAADGAAFVYFDPDGQPTLLGPTDGTALWDVRNALQGATHFRWAITPSQ